jgi:hypothetical protein
MSTWTANVVPDLNDAAGQPSFPSKLSDCVALKRAQFNAEHDAAALTTKLQELREREARVPPVRWRLREKWLILEEARALEAKLARVKSGEAKREFERRMKLYTAAAPPSSVAVLGKRYREADPAATPGTGGATPGAAPGAGGAGGAGGAAPGAAGGAAPGAEGAAAQKRALQAALRDEFVATQLGGVRGAATGNDSAGKDTCDRCGVAMLVMASDALLVCPSCSRTRLYVLATSSQTAYGEEVREFTSFSYKRHNHFQDWLNAFQAKESAEVPMDIVERVMAELHCRRVTSTGGITTKKVREILKDLKLRKYYDHTAQITARITGRPPPRMTPQQEEQCRLMFRAVEASFEVHCPSGRRNFLSYSFCLFKFCELLGWRRFLSCFSLLKGKDKLQRQDQIFKAICADLDWEFIPSL